MSVTHLSAPNIIVGTLWNIDAGTYQHWRAMSQNAKGRRRWLRRHKREDYRHVERDLAKSRGSRPRLGDWSIPATEGL